MKAIRAATRSEYWGLRCPRCGNTERFVEFMEYEAHFVDSRMNYVGLALGNTERYECFHCGTVVQPQMLQSTA